jgi:DNA-binding NarL/FixJ family response regulator
MPAPEAAFWKTMVTIARGMAHLMRGEGQAAAAALLRAADLAAATQSTRPAGLLRLSPAARLARGPTRLLGERCYEPLSERERRVLGLIAAGCSNQEIASALLVSVNTIKTHIKRIYEKLQVNSRVAAVERARELGLYG